MKDFLTKIVNSLLAITFAFGVVVVTYHLTSLEAGQLAANVLEGDGSVGMASASDIQAIEFVNPKGGAYPTNGIVNVQSVFVDFTAAAEGNGFKDGVLSGSDLENSFITFFSAGANPCGGGTVFSGNQIVMPSSFAAACTVGITLDGVIAKNTTDLTIEPLSCAQLRTSILRGYGEGFEDIVAGDLGTFAVTDNAVTTADFDDGFDFGSGGIMTSVDLEYPVTSVDGAKTFQIHVELAPDIATDAINGIASRAVIYSNNNNGVYEIKIRDEGTGNEVQTALNFAHVFNDLLGTDSPFIAFPHNANPEVIRLQATEMGVHPNAGYICKADGAQILPACFAGGGDSKNTAAGVLTTPLKLDNEVLQGETAIVFASNSAGEIEWVTSHPSVLEIVSLSEAAQQDEGTVDFQDVVMSPAVIATENTDEAAGVYNIMDCDKDYDDDDNYIPGTETCTIEFSIPIDYNISGVTYTANVSIEDEVVPVTVQGSTLSGFLEGSATYSSSAGVSVSLSGTVTGVVSGSVSGTYSGTVSGQIQATLQATGTRAGVNPGQVAISDFTGGAFTVSSPVTTGALTDVPGSFTSTVKKQEDDVSHVALLYAKRAGTSILTALDKQGCIASFDIDVIEKKVILDMVGREPGDVLDVSDTVQINAYAGGANQEIEELENITAASGIEWFSSNEEVATIDETGLLTALKPGVTNITARYDTGDTEIGTIESVPMQVTVNKISKLRVTFDKGTEDLLPNATVENAHESVIIAIHNPEAAGQTFVIEGQTVTIELPAGTYTNDISKVDAIVNDPAVGLAKKISDLQDSSATNDLINVTTIDGYPGMLILQPDVQNIDHDSDSIEDIDENGIIDIDTTALETDVTILPTYTNAIPLPGSETYGLMVIAQYDNGATKLLPPTQFSWVNTPVNYLEKASLDSGFITLGEISGTSTVVAEYENADGSVVRSNYLTITVDDGPVIDYVRRIGSASVTKGSRITLQTKISDIDTISDITSISTSLVYSTFNTFQQINEDSTAIWFTAIPYMNEMSVIDEGISEGSSVEGDEDEEGGDAEAETEITSEPQEVALQYRIYNIPIEIPADAGLFDGVYKMIISVTDAANHTLNYVYPIRIGEIGAGDVDGNGVTNMVDVIKAFQIASGINPSPTPSELQAANVDGVGGVTLVDVILLFNTVTNKQ